MSNESIKLLIFATLAAGFGVAAHRSALRLGLPATAVPVAGAVGLALLGRLDGEL